MVSIIISLILILALFGMGCIQDEKKTKENGSENMDETFPFVDEGLENITFADIAWKPDGKYALIVGHYINAPSNATILKFDGNKFTYVPTNITMKYDDESYRLTERMGILKEVAWSPDGKYALIVGRGGVVLKYDGTNLQGISGISYDYDLSDVAWNPKDNSFTILGKYVSYPYPGALWNYDGNKITLIGDDIGNSLTSIAWKPDGSYALITSMRGEVKLWRFDGNDFTPLSYEPRNVVYDVSWKTDGSYALIVGNKIVVKFDGEQFTIYHEDEIGISFNCEAVDWRPDGSYATIVGHFGRIIEFDGTDFTNISTDEYYTLFGIDWNTNGNYALIVGRNIYSLLGEDSPILKYYSNKVVEKVAVS